MLAVGLVEVHDVRLHRGAALLADWYFAERLLHAVSVDDFFLWSVVICSVQFLKGRCREDFPAAVFILSGAVHVEAVAMHLVYKGSEGLASQLGVFAARVLGAREDR